MFDIFVTTLQARSSVTQIGKVLEDYGESGGNWISPSERYAVSKLWVKSERNFADNITRRLSSKLIDESDSPVPVRSVEHSTAVYCSYDCDDNDSVSDGRIVSIVGFDLTAVKLVRLNLGHRLSDQVARVALDRSPRSGVIWHGVRDQKDRGIVKQYNRPGITLEADTSGLMDVAIEDGPSVLKNSPLRTEFNLDSSWIKMHFGGSLNNLLREPGSERQMVSDVVEAATRYSSRTIFDLKY